MLKYSPTYLDYHSFRSKESALHEHITCHDRNGIWSQNNIDSKEIEEAPCFFSLGTLYALTTLKLLLHLFNVFHSLFILIFRNCTDDKVVNRNLGTLLHQIPLNDQPTCTPQHLNFTQLQIKREKLSSMFNSIIVVWPRWPERLGQWGIAWTCSNFLVFYVFKNNMKSYKVQDLLLFVTGVTGYATKTNI
jgi:hypothetical protein